MKFGKKQLVLASLVLALGAAVYLNWQFSGTNRLPVENDSESESSSSELGAAQLVNNAYVETVSDDLLSSEESDSDSASGESGIAEARLQRQNARDEAVELLDEILEDIDSDTEAKKAAVEEAARIAQNILSETNIENLLSAKGFEESLAAISDGKCTVMISGEIDDTDSLIIQEVVMEQSGLTVDNIKIVEVK